MVIGNQMILKRPVFATFTLGYNHTPPMSTHTPVEQLQPFERGRIVDLREAGWHIDRLLHMVGTVYRWCVVAFSSGLWNIPTPMNQVLDGHLVQMHVTIDALWKRGWPPEQHPEKISGHVLHLLCHQGPLGTVCLQQDSDHVCLWPGYHLCHNTAKHGYSDVM